MERFTKRDEFGNADIIGVDSSEIQGNLGFNELNRVTRALNRLAELEDKLESGQLVELPCNVGDTVYYIDHEIEHTPIKQTVKYILSTDIVCCLEDQLNYSSAILFGLKMCYTDKAQAEARLKAIQKK